MTTPQTAKRIVLLSDGTGNSSAKLMKTNVWRMYEAIDLTKPDQVAMYDDGVGTSAFLPLAILGGALGVGLRRNVLDLYMFACRNYKPGDTLYAFGFSRGAFTIRVLLELIDSQGLIKDAKGRELEQLARAAYRKYRREFTGRMTGPMALIRDAVLSVIDGAHRRYKNTPTVKPDIAFVGLWDTVDAYGLPVDELTDAVDKWVWPLSLKKATLPSSVRKVCHAIALDDERQTFHPVLIDESAEAAQTNIHAERVTQVWFSGMHSNVGGGYPDDSLAHVTLKWMGEAVAKTGLRLHKVLVDSWVARADPNGPVSDSRRGLAAYYRYDPRRVAKLIADATGKPVIKTPKIHESVFDRIRAGRDDYAPIVLPQDYAVVNAAGDILTGAANTIETPARAQYRSREHDRIWNLVWLRRGVYFATIGTTFWLLAPALITSPKAGTAAGGTGFFDRGSIALSKAIDIGGRLLPDPLSFLTQYYREHPILLLFNAGLLVALLMSGTRLKRAIFDRSRKVWDDTLAAQAGAVVPPTDPDVIEKVRTSKLYQGVVGFTSRRLVPGVILAAAAFVVLGTLNRLTFAISSAAGAICHESKAVVPDSAGSWRLAFHPNELCRPTGIAIARGTTYRVRISLPAPPNQWRDLTQEILRPDGFGSGAGPQYIAGLPFRRLLSVPWFVPIARIGAQTAEYHPLDAGEATFTARKSGELFFFVNEAVGPLLFRNLFYKNNTGDSAIVTVTRM